LRFKQAFQFGKREQIFLPPGGALGGDQTREIERPHFPVQHQRRRRDFITLTTELGRIYLLSEVSGLGSLAEEDVKVTVDMGRARSPTSRR